MIQIPEFFVPLHPQFAKITFYKHLKHYESVRNRFHFDSRFV